VEANLQARKGLTLLQHLEEGPVRSRSELGLQILIGNTDFALKGEGASEAWEAMTRARALYDQLEDKSNLGQVLHMQGAHHVARHEYAAALRVAEDMLQLAREQNDAVREAAAHLLMGRSSHFLGEFSRAVKHFERALSVRTSEMNPSRDFFGRTLSADRDQVVALSHLANDLLILGHLDRALAQRNQALALARKTNDPYGLAIALAWASIVDRNRGAEAEHVE